MNIKTRLRKCSIRIITPLIILTSCATHEDNSSDGKGEVSNSKRSDTSQASNVSGYPAKPSQIDSTGAQAGNMSNTFRDSVKSNKK